MLRICMVLHHCEPPFGGPEVQALRLAERFMADGHQVLIIAKGSGKYPAFERLSGVPVYRLNRPGLASVEVLYRLFTLRDRFDVIHVHGTGRLATASISFARRFGKKVFVKVTMNKGIVKAAQPFVRTLVKKINPFRTDKVNSLKKADAMIAITHDIVDDLQNHGFEAGKIAYIPNGVDTGLFYPATADEKQLLRARLDLPLNKKIVVFTGKITKRKGIDVLLTAWEKTTACRTDALLLVVGSGIGQKDSLEAWAHTFVEQQLSDSVRLIGAVDNVADYLKASDIYVFPSRWEGLPNSLLEAMAVGLVCVASDIDGVNELIIPGETGVLTPVGDSDALAQALNEACLNSRPALAAAAALRILNDFSINATKERLEQLFEGK